jgi:hypothetical protein
MNRLKFILAVALAAGLAGCGPCQKKAAPPLTPAEVTFTEAVEGWTVGQWCEYRTTSSQGRKAKVRVALTGREPHPGGDYYWLEVTVERDDVRVVTKALVPQMERVTFLTGPKDLTKKSKRLIVKVGEEGAVELPLKQLQLLEAVSGAARGADLDEIFGGGEGFGSRDVGPAEYRTLAGKDLACRKIVLTDAGKDAGYFLGSDDVPVFGVAYSEHANGKLELVDFGQSGATTAITETPASLGLDLFAKKWGGPPTK